MDNLLHALLFTLFCWTSSTIKQPTPTIETPPAALVFSCGQELASETLHQHRPDLLEKQKTWEAKRYDRINKNTGTEKAFTPPYTLPVVVHVIHNGGDENISDAQIELGIEHMNQAFAGQGFYDQGNSVDTRIQFCLAQQDANGNLTTGINRVQSDLTDMDLQADDLAMKNLSRWDPLEYVNIWLVKEVCSVFSGCGVAGYAYLPNSHGEPVDGLVVEARFFGEDEESAVVAVHEMGHYLGLFHTFQGGCTNDNCLLNGDRVCDTPPDQSTSQLVCNIPANTCNTDVNPADPNNLFTTDQNDRTDNFMDYSSCSVAFTNGQTERMHDAIEMIRFSLLDSEGCLSPCPDFVEANFSASSLTAILGETIVFTENSIGATEFEWAVDGVVFVGDEYTFDSIGTFEVSLNVSNGNPNCVDEFVQIITVECPVQADFTLSNDVVNVDEVVDLTNASSTGTTYLWSVNGGNPSTTTDYSFSSNVPGIYNICLTADNGVCSTKVCKNLLVQEVGDCAPSSFQKLFERPSEGMYSPQLVNGNGQPTMSFRSRINGEYRYVISRHDENGSVEWMKGYYPGFEIKQRDFITTDDGGFMLLADDADSDGDILLIKTDAVGNFLWSKRINDFAITAANSITNTADGGYMILGSTSESFPFGYGLVVKLDAAGNTEWSYRFNDPNNADIYRSIAFKRMAEAPDGGYMLTANANTTLTWDSPYMLVKLTANGELEWAKSFDTDYEYCHTILLNENQDGYYLNNSIGLISATEFAIVEIDLEGNVLRRKVFDTPDVYDFTSHMTVLENGQFLINGYKWDADNSRFDLFLLLLDSQWNIVSAKEYGNVQYQETAAPKSHVVIDNNIFIGSTWRYNAPVWKLFFVKTNTALNGDCPSTPISFQEKTIPFVAANMDLELLDATISNVPVDFQVENLTAVEGVFCSSATDVCEICTNGLDDDGDGLVDYFDDDCPCEDADVCDAPYFNNCEESCDFAPPTDSFAMVGENTGTDVYAFYNVINAADVDGDCKPEIISAEGFNDLSLIVIDGESYEVEYRGEVQDIIGYNCAGDVDQDGRAEIFVIWKTTQSADYYLARYDYIPGVNDLFRTWTSSEPIDYLPTDFVKASMIPLLADFNQDGQPEVYVGNQIFDALTGLELVKMGDAFNRGGARRPGPGQQFPEVKGVRNSAIAIDLLDNCTACGGLELVAGNQVFSVDIQSYTNPSLNSMSVVAELPGLQDGVTSVADFDRDGDLDVVVADFFGQQLGEAVRVYVWDPQTNTRIGNIMAFSTEGLARISIPALGDLDGNGYPEIIFNTGDVIVLNDYLNAGEEDWGLNQQLTIKEKVNVGDHGMGVVLFDFELDGLPEIVIRNKSGLMIFDGDLNVKVSDPIFALTADEIPLIVDIDNDDEAEIITYATTGTNALDDHQLYIYESTSFSWPNTRKVWNQFSFLNVNINENGTVPQEQQLHHFINDEQFNSFNQQYAIPRAARVEAAVSILSTNCSATGVEVVLEICNEGQEPLPTDLLVTIYQGDPTTEPAIPLVTLQTGAALPAFQCMEITQVVNGSGLLFAVVNDDGTLPTPFNLFGDFPPTSLEECDYTNNIFGENISTINPSPLDLGPDKMICENGVFELNAGTEFKSYLWFDGSTEQTNTIFGAGTYWVEAVDSCGNVQADTIRIEIDPISVVDLGADVSACIGDTLTFTAAVFDKYKWLPESNIGCDTCQEFRLEIEQDTQVVLIVSSNLGCISIDTLNVNINNSANTFSTQTFCAGDTFLLNNTPIFSDTIIAETFNSATVCDSIHTTTFVFNETVFTEEEINICAGDTAIVFGNEITQDDVLTEIFNAINGCDSTHQISVVFETAIFTNEQLEFCAGDTAVVFGNEITENEMVAETFNSIGGCDSTHQINVVFNQPVFTSEQLQQCAGDTAFIFGNAITTDSLILETFGSINGCDSTHEVAVVFTDLLFTSEQLQLCTGDTAIVFGNEITADDFLMESYTSVNGCDSTHEVTIVFLDNYSTSEMIELCAGETIEIFGEIITENAVIEGVFNAVNGCDSTHQVTVEFYESYFFSEQFDYCEGDTAFMFGTAFTESETIIGNDLSINGCDSIYEVVLEFFAPDFTEEEFNICEGDSVFVFGEMIAENEILSQLYINENGCDSTHQVVVNVTPIIEETIFDTLCAGEYVLFFNDTIFDSGVYSQAVPSLQTGCDTTFVLNAEILPAIEFYLPSDTVLINENTFEIPLVTTDTDLIFNWSATDDLNCINCPRPIANLTENKNYQVTVTNSFGCSEVAAIQIYLRKENNIFIPNAFSPNGDDVNDFFTVFSAGQVTEILELQIFDRWGGLLFQEKNIKPDDPQKGWNGDSDGQRVLPGVYVYQVRLKMNDGGEERLSGEVVLVR